MSDAASLRKWYRTDSNTCIRRLCGAEKVIVCHTNITFWGVFMRYSVSELLSCVGVKTACFSADMIKDMSENKTLYIDRVSMCLDFCDDKQEGDNLAFLLWYLSNINDIATTLNDK